MAQLSLKVAMSVIMYVCLFVPLPALLGQCPSQSLYGREKYQMLNEEDDKKEDMNNKSNTKTTMMTMIHKQE